MNYAHWLQSNPYLLKSFPSVHIFCLVALLKTLQWDKMKVNLNPLPSDKILVLTKLKAFADEKLNVAKMTISLFDRVENTLGK